MDTYCTRRGRLASLLVIGLCVSACTQTDNDATTSEPPRLASDKPFAAGGSIHMQLAAGEYEIRAAADGHVRVTLSGNIGDTKVELSTADARADLTVKDTPHNRFHATIEVPKMADLVVRLTAGDLTMTGVTGNKDLESTAGDIKIGVGDPNDYATVDASVKAGDIHADPFGGSKSGLLQTFTWSGRGKYTLHANLGAGNLVLRSQ